MKCHRTEILIIIIIIFIIAPSHKLKDTGIINTFKRFATLQTEVGNIVVWLLAGQLIAIHWVNRNNWPRIILIAILSITILTAAQDNIALKKAHNADAKARN